MTAQPTATEAPIKARIIKIEIEKNTDIIGDAMFNEWKVTTTRQDGTREISYRDTIPHEGDARMVGYYYAGFKAGAMVWKARAQA